MKSFLEEVQKRWFLLGIVAVITLAKLEPFLGAKGGVFILYASTVCVQS